MVDVPEIRCLKRFMRWVQRHFKSEEESFIGWEPDPRHAEISGQCFDALAENQCERWRSVRVFLDPCLCHHPSCNVSVVGDYSMWVNRKLRRDCPGNPSKLGVESHQENGEPRPPTARARVAPLCRRCAANWDGCGESLSVTWVTLRHARSRTAL